MRYYKNGNITTSPTIPNVISPSRETIIANGWFEYVDQRPQFDAEIEKIVRGEVIEGVVQYQKVTLTAEELEEIKKQKYEAEKPDLIQKALLKVAEIVIKGKFDLLSEDEKTSLIALFEYNPSGEIKVRDGKLVKEEKQR